MLLLRDTFLTSQIYIKGIIIENKKHQPFAD